MRITMLAAAAVLLFAGPASAQNLAHEQQARSIFERLISYRSTALHREVPTMAHYIAAVLKQGGVPEADIAMLPLEETTAMLVRLPGTDITAKPILFSSHMDVVEANPDDWDRNPFQLVEENGFFFGRGTLDNKAGVTALVSAILRLKESGPRPRRTVLFAFIGDEETGMQTTQLVADHPWVRGAEYAINTDAGGGDLDEEGRPVVYFVQSAEKAYATYQLTVRNPGGHSSMPREDNAIYELADALAKLRAYQFATQSNSITRAQLEAIGKRLRGDLGEAMLRFAEDPENEAAAAVIASHPEYVGFIRTTCVATMIEGGHAENALPQRAAATVNCRIFPGMSAQQVQSVLTEVTGNPSIAVTVSGTPTVSPASEPRGDVMAAITRWVDARYPGTPVVPDQSAYATDGNVYRAAGIPTYGSSGVFMKISDLFAHGLNERIPVRSFYEQLDHTYTMVRALAGATSDSR